MNKSLFLLLGFLFLVPLLGFTQDVSSVMSSLKIKNNDDLKNSLADMNAGLNLYFQEDYKNSAIIFKRVEEQGEGRSPKWSIENGVVGTFAGYVWISCINKILDKESVNELVSDGVMIDFIKTQLDLYGQSGTGARACLTSYQSSEANEGLNQTSLGNIHDGDFAVFEEVTNNSNKYMCELEYGSDGSIHVKAWKRPGLLQKLWQKISGGN